MKNIFLVFIAMTSFVFAANAQSCCQSKNKANCTKKTECVAETAAASGAKAALVTNTSTEKTEKFTVYGNCGMCEQTIENALKDVDGVSKGDWDRETDVMTVVFNPEKISLDDIKQKIAGVGYDSDTHRAEDEVYNNLPSCCQYERSIN